MPTGGKKKHIGKVLVAGGICGAIDAVVSYPTEFVKTQLQLFEDKAKMGPIQCAKDTIKTHGEA